jgi:hypothetical protein
MADAAGTCLYVSLRSGEVIQRTVRVERAWNWVGAIVHWINPTLLRKHQGRVALDCLVGRLARHPFDHHRDLARGRALC